MNYLELKKSKDNMLFQVSKNNKYGFINGKGEVVIDFLFEEVTDFSEGMARFYQNDKVGFINEKGIIIVEAIYDDAMPFREGLAIIKQGDDNGYINKKGELVIYPQFYDCQDFHDGLALVMDDILSSGKFINNLGEIVLDGKMFLLSKYSEGLINFSENDQWGYMDVKGNYIIEPQYKFANPFCEGLAAVSLKGSKENVFGFIDKENNFVIPPIHQGADMKFSENLCAVWKDAFGFIDKKGELVISYQYENVGHFSEGFAYFLRDGKYGFIDKKGNEVIAPNYRFVGDFKNGIASVTIGDSFDTYKSGYINSKGEYIWEPGR